MKILLVPEHNQILPDDAESAILIGRVFVPEYDGPAVVLVQGDQLVEISSDFPTVTSLLENCDPVTAIENCEKGKKWNLTEVVQNSVDSRRGL